MIVFRGFVNPLLVKIRVNIGREGYVDQTFALRFALENVTEKKNEYSYEFRKALKLI